MESSYDVVVVRIEQKCKIDKMTSRSDKTSVQTSLSPQVLAICDTAVPDVLGSPTAHAFLQGELLGAYLRQTEAGKKGAKPQPSPMAATGFRSFTSISQ